MPTATGGSRAVARPAAPQPMITTSACSSPSSGRGRRGVHGRIVGAGRTAVCTTSVHVDADLRAGRQRRSGDGRTGRERWVRAQGRGDRHEPGHLPQIPARHLPRPETGITRAVEERGPDGGFVLARPATDISLADIFRAVDGPLADVHDESVRGLEYPAPAESLPEVWMAVRASLRSVLETVSIADLVAHDLPGRDRTRRHVPGDDPPALRRPARPPLSRRSNSGIPRRICGQCVGTTDVLIRIRRPACRPRPTRLRTSAWPPAG